MCKNRRNIKLYHNYNVPKDYPIKHIFNKRIIEFKVILLVISDADRLAAIERLEKKVRRRLLQGKTEEVIADIRYLINQYRELRMLEKADMLEATLNQFINESLQGGSGGSY